jgi:hypothetical protein
MPGFADLVFCNFCCLLEEGIEFAKMAKLALGCFSDLGCGAFAGHVVKRRITSQNVVKRRGKSGKVKKVPAYS